MILLSGRQSAALLQQVRGGQVRGCTSSVERLNLKRVLIALIQQQRQYIAEFLRQCEGDQLLGVTCLQGSLLTFQLFQINHNPQHTFGHFRLSVTTDDRSTFADGWATGGDVTANWQILSPLSSLATDGTILNAQADGSILASGLNSITSIYTITAMTSLENITGFRLEALEDPSLPFSGPGRYPANGNFVLTEFQVSVVAVPEPHLATAGLVAAVVFLWRRKRSAAR